MMEQFTDKEIFDEFVKRFNLEKESTEKVFCNIFADKIVLTDGDENYLGNMRFTFNERGQFIDDLPVTSFVTVPYNIDDEIYSMDYDSLISLLGEIVEKLKSE